MDDPVFKAKIAQAQKARRINTTVQVLDVMSDFADMDFSNVMNQTKEGRKINKVLSSFGIQDLAQEALMCITLGIGASVAKVTDSVRDSIVNGASVSFNSPPTLPSMQVDMERPSFDSIKIGSYFSITGDPPLKKRIVDMLLGVVAQAAFEVIKGLAEFITFNCGDILDGERGTVDCGAEIKNRNQMAVPSFPDLPELLSGISENYGLALDDAYNYMSDVSIILTPIEICRLLNSPRLVTEETIENILAFNEEYPDEMVRLNLNTRIKIVSFFQSSTFNIDTTTMCNEIVQQTLLVAVEGCEICLDQGTILGMQPGIEALIDLAENGFQPPPPSPPDFLCPEHDSYLSNPIAEITIPNLFNQFMDTAAIYMAGSLEAARTSLLEPVVVSSVPRAVQEACDQAGVELEPVEVNTKSLDIITDILDWIQDLTTAGLDLGENCPDISGPKFQELIEDIEVIVQAVNAAMGEIPGAVEDIRDKIASVKDDLEGGGEPRVPHTEYVFPQKYTEEFKGAILMNEVITGPEGSPTGLMFEGMAASGAINSYETGFAPGGAYMFMGPSNKGTVLDFTFGNATSPSNNDYVRINYAPWTDSPGGDLPLALEYSLGSVGVGTATITPQGTLYGSALPGSGSLTEPWTDLIEDTVYEQTDLNPYIFRFARPLWSWHPDPEGLFDPQQETNLAAIVGKVHPLAYTSVIRGVYDYIMHNGSFSAGGPKGINNLSLFKNNANCTPEDMGDLFDADGIIDQMQKEFAQAACFDGGSSKDKVRNSLYFGFINMLIQAVIDEFIVSNIVVLSALQMDDVLNPRYPFRDILTNQVVSSINQVILDGNSNIEKEIFNYFDRRSKRPSTVEQGGFTYSYAPTEVVPGFETPDFLLNNTALISFLVAERLGYVWEDASGAERSTIQAIKNVIDPKNLTKSFQDILLEDILFGAFDGFSREVANPYVDVEEIVDQASEEHLHYHSGDLDWTIHKNDNPDDIPPGAAGYVNEHNVHGETSYPGDHTHPVFTALGPSFPGNAYTNDALPPTTETPMTDGANVQTLPGSSYFGMRESLYIIDDTDSKNLQLMGANTPLLSWSYTDSPGMTMAQKFAFIKEQSDYQLFIHQAINIHSCFMVPLLHNFFLTNKHFPDMRNSFTSVKRAIIHMFNMTEQTNQAPLLAPRDGGFSNTIANNGIDGS